MLFRSFVALALIGMSFGFVVRMENRIVGGRNTTIEQRPWHAALSIQTNSGENATFFHLASGAILGPQLIVTVANAVTDANGTLSDAPYFVRVGSSQAEEGGILVPVARVDVHPSYNKTTSENDLALLFLSEVLEFDESVNVIALPSADAEPLPEGTNVTLSGWVIQPEDGETFTPELQVVDQVIVSQAACAAAYSNDTGLINANTTCAASELERTGPCPVSRIYVFVSYRI